MEEFVSISLDEIKTKIEGKDSLYLVSVDYDNKNGVRLEKNIELSQLEKILDEVKNFYKLYIFNDEFMLSVFNLGENEYRYNKILKENFNEQYKEKYVYMKTYGKLKVRIGKINNREVVQYVEFGGEK